MMQMKLQIMEKSALPEQPALKKKLCAEMAATCVFPTLFLRAPQVALNSCLVPRKMTKILKKVPKQGDWNRYAHPVLWHVGAQGV